jgi:hypothetical protein
LRRVRTWLESGSWLEVGAWLEGPSGRRAVGATLLLQVAVVVAFALVYRPFDLAIYLWGGQAVTHGAQLYLVQSHANWFTYPPFAALLFTPLGALPVAVVQVLWELVSIAALGWACALSLRLTVTAAVTFVCCGAIGFLVDPSASLLYWSHLFYDTTRVSATYISNQSPYGALTRFLGGAGHVCAWYCVIPVTLGGLGLGLGLAVAATLARRGDWLAAGAVTGVTGLLVSPISWTHHWVWALPALVVLARGGLASRVAAGCAYLVFVLAPMWWTPHSGESGDYGSRGVVTVIANCFLIAGLAFLGHMTVQTVRMRRSPADEAWLLPTDSRYAGVSASAAARMVVAK